MTEIIQRALAVIGDAIKEHGLIVLALMSLMWQVWWLTQLLDRQDTAWRTELSAYRAQMEQMEAHRQTRAERTYEGMALLGDRVELMQQAFVKYSTNCK